MLPNSEWPFTNYMVSDLIDQSVGNQAFMSVLVCSAIGHYNWPMSQRLTHIDDSGQAKMVDVGHKLDTERVAVARGAVAMQPETLQLIVEGNIKKGDVFGRILLGSQVSMIIPKNVNLKIKKHDKVYAGKTVIAEWK